MIGMLLAIDSLVRLEADYLIEYQRGWRTDRSYIKREKVVEAMKRKHIFMGTNGKLKGMKLAKILRTKTGITSLLQSDSSPRLKFRSKGSYGGSILRVSLRPSCLELSR
jgi:hypothetical protein